MPRHTHSHFHTRLYSPARPFDEFLVADPTVNTGSVIYTGSSFGQPSYDPKQRYGLQSILYPGTFPQTPSPTLIPSFSSLFRK